MKTTAHLEDVSYDPSKSLLRQPIYSCLNAALSWNKKYPSIKVLALYPIEEWTRKGPFCTCCSIPILCGNAGAHAIGSLSSATNRPAQIRDLWKRHPGAQVGGLTGRAGGLVAVFFDDRKKPSKRYQKILELVEEAKTLSIEYKICRAFLFFIDQEGTPTPSLKRFYAPGVSLAADGTFIVLPPSITWFSSLGACQTTKDRSGGEWVGTPPEEGLYEIQPLPVNIWQLINNSYATQKKYGGK